MYACRHQIIRVVALFAFPLVLALSQIAPACAQSTQSGQAAPSTPPTKQEPASSNQPPPLAAADTALPELIAEQTRITAAVEAAEKTIDRSHEDEKQLSEIRTELEKLEARIDELSERTSPQIAAITDQLAKLGKEPEKGAEPEPGDIARERARLRDLSNRLGAISKSVDLAATRADQLIDRIKALRQAIFAKHLLRQDRSPITLQYWQEVANEIEPARRLFEAVGQDTTNALQGHSLRILIVGPLIVLGAVFLTYFSHGILRRLTPDIAGRIPFYRRAKSALVSIPILAIPPTAVALLFYSAIHVLELAPSYLNQVIWTGLIAALVFILISSLTRSILTPVSPQWRLVSLSASTSAWLAFFIHLAAFVYVIELVLTEFVQSIYIAPPLAITLRFFTNLAGAIPIFALTSLPLAGPDKTGTLPKSYQPIWVKLPLMSAATVVIAASAIGYINFGNFILGQLFLFAAGIAIGTIFHWAIRSFIARPPIIGIEKEDTKQHVDPEAAARRRRLLGHATAATFDIALLIATLPFLMLTWGFSTSDIQTGAKAAIFGFEIGEFRISLARIVLAMGLFLLLIFLTRLVQKTLQQWLEGASPSEAGVGNSIRAFVGYVGTALALLAGLSYAGFDITNVALVAGALSVGIGFGLQSIVNNFVSGIILLFERPIKVGDWVIVNGNEGFVRRISVRATEIETFDHSSIIVPNSEFITGSITNWTHRSALGRGIIRVGVSYESNPVAVRDLLLEVARNSKQVLAYPSPYVAFEDFGGSSLDFSLRVYLADVTKRLDALTQLRFEIHQALKDAKIEIPYPQTDIHIRDLDPVREVITMAMRAKPSTTGSNQ